MAIPEHDNRIQFPPTLVDFDNVVGVTGQTHDTYPAPGQQPRYDWARIYLLALLSCQSSDDPPTQYRTGTIWYNRTKRVYYIWNGTDWMSLASAISLLETSTGVIDLATWYAEASQKLDILQPKFTFSGTSVANNVTSIPIPNAVVTVITPIVSYLRPLVYINGFLVDPRLCNFVSGCPNCILLSGTAKLSKDDTFTVIIERFDYFVTEEVIAS